MTISNIFTGHRILLYAWYISESVPTEFLKVLSRFSVAVNGFYYFSKICTGVLPCQNKKLLNSQAFHNKKVLPSSGLHTDITNPSSHSLFTPTMFKPLIPKNTQQIRYRDSTQSPPLINPLHIIQQLNFPLPLLLSCLPLLFSCTVEN